MQDSDTNDQVQSIQTHVGAEDAALSRHAQEICQLSGSAASLEDQRAFRDLLVKQARKDAAARLLLKTCLESKSS